MSNYYHPQAIKSARKKLGWSQEKLGSLSGFSRHAVSKTETRTHPINTVAINYIAETLNEAGTTVSPIPVVRSPFVHKVNIPLGHYIYRPEPAPKERCNARKRNGRPCLNWPITGKKRCKFHGGMSTGPMSKKGSIAISLAQKKRWQKYRQARFITP